MITAAFIFEVGEQDEEFLNLDRMLEQAAKETAGFLNKEVWVAPDGKRRNSTYYWKDHSALMMFSNHPKHIEAQKLYSTWGKRFRVIIAEVINS